MLKLLKRMGKYWWLCALLVLVIICNVICTIRIPEFLGQMINLIQNSGSKEAAATAVTDIAIVALDILLIAGIACICGVIESKLASVITAHLVAKTRYDFFKKVGEFSSNEINKFSVSSLVTRTTNDLTMVTNTMSLFFRYILYGPLIAVFAIIYLVDQSIKQPETWGLTFVVFGALALIMVAIIVIINVALPKYQAIQSKLDKVALVTRENLEGLRVVRAYNAEEYQEAKFENYNTDLMKTEMFANRALGLLVPSLQLIIGVLNVGIYFMSSTLVNGSTFQYATISVITEFAALILIGFVMITVVVVQLPRTLVCLKRINEVIDTEVSVVGQEETPVASEIGTIEFRDVTFTYPGADKPVLSHVSFKVNRGETIAFIGATGAGKTTLVNLITRFFDATEGEVLVDGINVKDYKLADLFNKFGYVPQRGYLFHDSLVNNITLGKPDAAAPQIQRALEISQSAEFVSKLPGGLDYEISQGGKNVSGGQRQRLCIARAIIMEPEIFIFDDSFSALDYRTDKVLRGEIKKQCEGVTNVIVAQRVGTIIDADQIIVLDGGDVCGVGTHKELLKTSSVYKEIALSQLSEEELENGGK